MSDPKHCRIDSLPSSFLLFISWYFLLLCDDSLCNPIILLCSINLSKEFNMWSSTILSQSINSLLNNKSSLLSKANTRPFHNLCLFLEIGNNALPTPPSLYKSLKFLNEINSITIANMIGICIYYIVWSCHIYF